jgi:hypothetical protein
MNLIKVVCGAMVVLIVAGTAGDARADGYINPFYGVNFGGSAGSTFVDRARHGDRTTWGFQAGGMGGGIFGGEFDLAYTKNFFGDDPSLVNNSLLTSMGNIIIGIPIGGQHGAGIRPYGTAGLGMVRRQLSLAPDVLNGVETNILDGNDFAYSLGFGAMGFFADHIGIRADYRYIRNFKTDDLLAGSIKAGTFNYSRATAGVLFRF